MKDLKINYSTDSWGNRHTHASYTDDDGCPCGTQLNGHLMKHEVEASILNFQRRTKERVA